MSDDARENALAILEHLAAGIQDGQLTGLVVAAESDGGMQFFTTYDFRATIAMAGLTNHWAISRVLTDAEPHDGLLQ